MSAKSPTASLESRQVSVRDRRSLAYPIQETVATEEPLEIRLAHGPTSETVAVTMRTPTDDAALAVGFLFTEGILTDPSQVAAVEVPTRDGDHVVTVRTRELVRVDPERRRQFLVNSSCGVCGRALVQGLFAERGGPVRSDLVVAAADLAALPERLRGAQPLFERTGGLHAAGLFGRDGALLMVAEDVGRHNAVDKVVGARFLAGEIPLSERVLQVSGRASFEIVQKAAAAGIPIVGAVSAPSSLAITAADRLGVTLAGFVRDGRFTVYAHPERIATDDGAGP